MREKYESLSLAALRDIAKARKLKGVSTMKKSELIELMLEQDEKDKAKEVKEEIKNEKAGVADIEQLDSGNGGTRNYRGTPGWIWIYSKR